MPKGHLTSQERETISLLHHQNYSQTDIAQRLGRDKGTVSRELKRNSTHGFYLPQQARQKARQRRTEAKQPWKMDHGPLRKYVLKKLRKKWSPETIAGRLRRDFPDEERLHVCASTVYNWLEQDRHAGGTLWRLLPWQQGRVYRKRRKTNHQNQQGRIVGRVGIEQRPQVVDQRTRYGDWEADTIHGKGASCSLLTSLERKSRYLVAVKVQDRTAETMQQVIPKVFRHVPRTLRETITLDNGKEFAKCPQLAGTLGLDIYHADPYAAWQRGANENANGLLRKYFPKGTDFRKVSAQDLARVVREINQRPRKCLDFQTPLEVFRQARRRPT